MKDPIVGIDTLHLAEAHGGSAPRIRARSLYVAERLGLRALPRHESVALGPLTVRAGEGGYAVLFRCGAVVLFGLSGGEEKSFLGALTPSIRGRLEVPSCEDLEILLDPDREEGFDEDGMLSLGELNVERLQVRLVGRSA